MSCTFWNLRRKKAVAMKKAEAPVVESTENSVKNEATENSVDEKEQTKSAKKAVTKDDNT